MSPLDRIARIELEESRKVSEEYVENVQLQKNKLKYSHPYDKFFLVLFWNEVLKIIVSKSYNHLIFLGGGSGNEAAYIKSKLQKKNRIILTDLSYHELRYYKEVFKNYSVSPPNGVLACSFNELPFSRLPNKYCAVAFLCLHHSKSIEQIILHMLEIFDELIIFEPITNRFLKSLSKFKISQRSEEVDYKPSRVHVSFLDNLKSKFNVTTKTYIQIPRDYLPFISHRQRIIFMEDNMKIERMWSRLFFGFQLFLNYFFSKIQFGNMALIHISRKTE